MRIAVRSAHLGVLSLALVSGCFDAPDLTRMTCSTSLHCPDGYACVAQPGAVGRCVMADAGLDGTPSLDGRPSDGRTSIDGNAMDVKDGVSVAQDVQLADAAVTPDASLQADAPIDLGNARDADTADTARGGVESGADVPSATAPLPNTVRIGQLIYPLSGEDPGIVGGWGGDPGYPGSRGIDQLIVYTGASGSVTVTNQWGIECSVDAHQTLIAQYDRQSLDSLTGTTIPAGGYVLSGHGKAADWLLANATPGVKVELVYLAPAGGGTATGGAGGEGTGAGGAGGGASAAGRVRVMWHNGWGGPALTSYPSDVMAGLSHISLGMSQSAASGTGKLTPPPGVDASQVSYAHTKGVLVFVGMGGSSDGGITITSSATAQDAINSLLSFRSSLGIDGVDIDLEPSGSNWNTAGIDAFISGCVSNGLRFGITSGLYDQWTDAWGAVVKAWADKIDFWASMDYDFPEAGSSELNGVVVSKIKSQRTYGIPDRKIVEGFAPRPDPDYTNASPSGVIPPAYAAGKAIAPDLGWMIWEDLVSSKAAWQDCRALISAN
jgi:hypothetical protein